MSFDDLDCARIAEEAEDPEVAVFRRLLGAVEYWELFVMSDSVRAWLTPETEIDRTRSEVSAVKGVRDKWGGPKSISTRGVADILVNNSSAPAPGDVFTSDDG